MNHEDDPGDRAQGVDTVNIAYRSLPAAAAKQDVGNQWQGCAGAESSWQHDHHGETVTDKVKGRRTDIDCAFKFLNSLRFTPSLVFVLSDFFAPFDYESSLKSLVRKHDVIPIIISDIREESLPKVRGFVAVKDLETQGVKYLDLSQDLIVNQQHIDLFNKLNLGHLTLKTDQGEERWVSSLSDFFDKRIRRRSRIKR